MARIAKVKNLRRKCYKCNRTKEPHLFSKGNDWCKLCFNRWRKNHKETMKSEDFHRYKAQQFRSNWRRRATQLGVSFDTVPPTKEIKLWLDSQVPYTCYYTGKLLGRDFGVDHLVPIAKGGGLGFNNLCLTSPFINGAKGMLTDEEFKSLLDLIKTWKDGGVDLLQRLQSSNQMFQKKR